MRKESATPEMHHKPCSWFADGLERGFKVSVWPQSMKAVTSMQSRKVLICARHEQLFMSWIEKHSGSKISPHKQRWYGRSTKDSPASTRGTQYIINYITSLFWNMIFRFKSAGYFFPMICATFSILYEHFRRKLWVENLLLFHFLNPFQMKMFIDF